MTNTMEGRAKPGVPVRVLLARVYAPGTYNLASKVEFCRTIARNVDLHEEMLAKVPKVGDEFLVDLIKYICLRVDELCEIPDYAAVVFVAKSM